MTDEKAEQIRPEKKLRRLSAGEGGHGGGEAEKPRRICEAYSQARADRVYSPCNENDDDMDEMARKLQAAIREQERATFTETVLQEYNDPQNVGRMADADGSGVINGPCGDTMEIYLKARDGRITETTFMTDGCGPTIACGSRLTKMVKGRSVEEAGKVADTDLIEALGGLPEENLHCAKLAVDTLQKALEQYYEGK